MVKHLLILFLPLILSNTIHMVVVKLDLFSVLKTPLSRVAFGKNKTFRGFLIVPFLNGILVLFFSQLLQLSNPLLQFFAGFLIGLVYLLAELPNSFLKRKLGIPAGGSSESNKILFSLLDKCDSTIGVNLAYFFLYSISLSEMFALFLLSLFVHSFFSWLLVKLSIKKSF